VRLYLGFSLEFVGTRALYAEIPARVVEEGHGFTAGHGRIDAGDVEVMVPGRVHVDDGAL
jgi:hypothetical protein